MPGAISAILARRQRNQQDEDHNDVSNEDESTSKREELLELLHDGATAQLVQNRYFEQFTLFVISLNALWIGIDLELNTASMWTEAHPVFQVADNSFCLFFSFEVVVRFLAFRNKLMFWKDTSFCFDSVLVIFMVVETWVLVIVAALGSGSSGGSLRQLSMLRLLRLLRLTRMVRLMRSLPELMTLMKGMVRALRSVGVTFTFLLGLMWVFSIVFNQQYRDAQGPLHDEFFMRVPLSMVTFFVNGTLLDEVTGVARLLLDDNAFLFIAFLLFVLGSSLTLLNMLIGVLTDVVSKTADEESRLMALKQAQLVLKAVFDASDVDGDAKLSKVEFDGFLEDENSPIRSALLDLGICEDRLGEVSELLFCQRPADKGSPPRLNGEAVFSSGSPKTQAWSQEVVLTFPEFMDELMQLLPKKRGVCVREILSLKLAASQLAASADGAMLTAQKELTSLAEECSTSSIDVGMLVKAPCQRGRLSVVPTAMLLDELSRRLEVKRWAH